MWIEVTANEFKNVLREALNEGKQQTLYLLEEDPEENGWLLSTFRIDENSSLDRTTQELSQNQAFKFKGAVYKLVDEAPLYTRTFRDDTEYVVEFQTTCDQLASAFYSQKEEDFFKYLAELVDMYRMSERSGYSLADMYIDDTRLLADIQGEQESFSPPEDQ